MAARKRSLNPPSFSADNLEVGTHSQIVSASPFSKTCELTDESGLTSLECTREDHAVHREPQQERHVHIVQRRVPLVLCFSAVARSDDEAAKIGGRPILSS